MPPRACCAPSRSCWHSIHSLTPGIARRRFSGISSSQSAQWVRLSPTGRWRAFSRASSSLIDASICSLTAPSCAHPPAIARPPPVAASLTCPQRAGQPRQFPVSVSHLARTPQAREVPDKKTPLIKPDQNSQLIDFKQFFIDPPQVAAYTGYRDCKQARINRPHAASSPAILRDSQIASDASHRIDFSQPRIASGPSQPFASTSASRPASLIASSFASLTASTSASLTASIFPMQTSQHHSKLLLPASSPALSASPYASTPYRPVRQPRPAPGIAQPTPKKAAPNGTAFCLLWPTARTGFPAGRQVRRWSACPCPWPARAFSSAAFQTPAPQSGGSVRG